MGTSEEKLNAELATAELEGIGSGAQKWESASPLETSLYGGLEAGSRSERSGGSSLLTQFWQAVRMTRPDGVGSVGAFGPVDCRPGPMTAAKRLEAMVYGEGNCRSDQQFWIDLEASMSRAKMVAVAGQQAEAIWNNRYQIGAILVGVMKGMEMAERSARRGNWKGVVAAKLASGFGKLVAPAAVGYAVKEWLTAVEDVNGDPNKLPFAQEKYAQVVLAVGVWLGAKLPGLRAKEGVVANEVPRRVIVVPHGEAAVAGREVAIAERAVAASGGRLTASAQPSTKFTPPLAVSGAAMSRGGVAGEGEPPAQFPESGSIAASGNDIVGYDPTTHKIALADGRQLDERSTLVMWDGDSWQLGAIKQSIASLRPFDGELTSEDPGIEVSLGDIRLIPTPAGGAPGPSGNGTAPRVSPWLQYRGLLPLQLSIGRQQQKAEVIAQIRALRRTPYVFPKRNGFADPLIVRATVDFFTDWPRVAARLLEIGDHATQGLKESETPDWQASVSRVVASLERRAGFDAATPLPWDKRLLRGALLAEMAANPGPFTLPSDRERLPLDPPVLWQQLDPVWAKFFPPGSFERLMGHFPELKPGYRLQRSEQQRPFPLPETLSVPDLRQPIQIRDRIASVHRLGPLSRALLEVLLREYNEDRIGEFIGYVPVEEIDDLIFKLQSNTPRKKAVEILRLALESRNIGNIDYITIGNNKGLRLRLSGDTSGRLWRPVVILGVRVWLYIAPQHLEALKLVLENESVTRAEIVDHLRSRYPGKGFPERTVRDYLDIVDEALHHAKLNESDSKGDIHVASIVQRGLEKREHKIGVRYANEYGLEPTDSLFRSQPSNSRLGNVETWRDYVIDGATVQAFLRPISGRVLEHFLQEIAADRASGKSEIGFVEESRILNIARDEWERLAPDRRGPKPTKAWRVVFNLSRSLEKTHLGTILYDRGKRAYQFQPWDKELEQAQEVREQSLTASR